jgi:hypothetical protein
MKLVRIFSAFVLALVLTAAALAQENKAPNQASPQPAGPAPKMVIDSLTHDFGELVGGPPLRHVFKVKNEGKGALEIKSVVPG